MVIITDVLIHYNNETGKWLYSIASIDDPSYWIDSFDTMEEVVEYCKVNGYNILKEVIDKCYW